jgi:hypothetical protein
MNSNPIAQVNWTENGHERVQLWMDWCFVRISATYKDAEVEAHAFAKSWIDDNPNLERFSKSPPLSRLSYNAANRNLIGHR